MHKAWPYLTSNTVGGDALDSSVVSVRVEIELEKTDRGVINKLAARKINKLLQSVPKCQSVLLKQFQHISLSVSASNVDTDI